MAQLFIIGVAALGGAVLLLQKERATIATSQSVRADPLKHVTGGATINQEAAPPPVDGGAFGPVMGQSSDDGTVAGDPSCSPSSPTSNAAGIGAISPTSGPPAIMADMDSFIPPSTDPKAPSEGTVRGTAANESPPTIPPTFPSTTYRDYLIGITYGLGSKVTRREESDNMTAVGPSVGAVW